MPESKSTSHNWLPIGAAKGYTVWHDGEIYQVTKGDRPGNEAGYRNLDALLRLKGLDGADIFPEIEDIHVVTEAEHREWHEQFNEEAAKGMRLEMKGTELSYLVSLIVEQQLEEEPSAGQVDSGLILRTISDHGFSGAFEGLVEEAAETALKASAPGASVSR